MHIHIPTYMYMHAHAPAGSGEGNHLQGRLQQSHGVSICTKCHVTDRTMYVYVCLILSLVLQSPSNYSYIVSCRTASFFMTMKYLCGKAKLRP